MAKSKPKPKPPTSSGTLGLDAFTEPQEEGGLSLDQLGAAFAEMLSTGDDPYGDDSKSNEDAADVQNLAGPDATISNVTDPPPEEDACEISPRTILEAILFVGSPASEPVSGQQVASLMRGVRPAEIDQHVRELNDHYQTQGCPYTIVSEGAGYRLTLRDEYHRIRDRFYGKVRQARISQAAIEVLSLVAYHEPISAEEINKQRGTSSSAILSQLVRRQLLRLDRSDPAHRRGLYYTTPRFLQLFGLESLADLPRSDDAPPS